MVEGSAAAVALAPRAAASRQSSSEPPEWLESPEPPEEPEPLEPEPLEPEPPGVEPEPLEPEPELSSVRTRSPPLSSPGSAGAI